MPYATLRQFLNGQKNKSQIVTLSLMIYIFYDKVNMSWTVELHAEFAEEFKNFSDEVQDKIYADVLMLETFGYTLGRPKVDTLKASQHSNMKELRFDANDGVWRVAFAFDTERKAILLVAGDKSGTSEKRFYKQLIKKADERFTNHLQSLKEKKK